MFPRTSNRRVSTSLRYMSAAIQRPRATTWPAGTTKGDLFESIQFQPIAGGRVQAQARGAPRGSKTTVENSEKLGCTSSPALAPHWLRNLPTCHLSRDVGVSIAVSAHPGGQLQGGGVQRQLAACGYKRITARPIIPSAGMLGTLTRRLACLAQESVGWHATHQNGVNDMVGDAQPADQLDYRALPLPDILPAPAHTNA